MSSNQTKRWLSLAAVIAVAVMIFLFSAQKGEESAKLSGDVTEFTLNSLVPGYPEFPEPRKQDYRARTDVIVRKLAHFSEYALLGLTLFAHLHYVLIGKRYRFLALVSWLIATLYACTDELHQMFVSNRGPALFDVGIDSAGALTGAFVGMGLILLWHRYRQRKSRLA